MTPGLQGEINHPHSDGIVFGVGACRQRLQEVLDRTAIHRAFLVTTPSVASSPLVKTAREAIGLRLAGEFSGSKAQSPKSVIVKAVQQVKEAKVDGLISLGGSSVVDVTKGVALVLAEGEHLDPFLANVPPPVVSGAPRAPRLPHIALPTTLSGAEYSPYLGITDDTKHEKHIYLDKGVAPRFVLLDAELTLYTPSALWAATGMKLLADCLEETCSPRSNPYTDALSLTALKMVFQGLRPSLDLPLDCELRGRILFASFMSAMNFSTTSLGLVAALRHPLGGRGVAHGVASTIVLPHVLNWNMASAADKLAHVSAELGLGSDPERLVEATENLTRSLALPNRLRDVGINRADLPGIAEHAAHSFSIATNPRPVKDPSELVAVLENAW